MAKTKILGIVAVIIMTAVFALGIASLATPWWTYQSDNKDLCSYIINFEWRNLVASQTSCANCGTEAATCAAAGTSNGQSWRAIYCNTDVNSPLCKNLPMIFDASFALMIIGTVIAGILIILSILGLLASTILPKFLTLKVLALKGFFVMICFLIAVIVIACAIPPTYNEASSYNCGNAPGCTFIGQNGTDGHWGPTVGWILAVVAAGLSLIYSILMCVA